ncbi:MAG: glycosyltransferase family 2 protein [Methanobacteriaceae archaeon]
MILSIVIPNYNGKKFLKTCFESIKPQLTNDYEVIIVDNGSSDGSVNFIKSNYILDYGYNRFSLIENNDNLGFAKAVNQGIKAAKGEFVFLLNNDVELDENCLENIVKCANKINSNKNTNFFAIGAKMLQFKNRNLIDDAGDEYNLLAWTKKVGEGKIASKYNNNYEIFSACGGAALYNRSVFKEIGYFDEKFFAYMEDVDISYRAQINGYSNYFCSDAIVYHIGSASSGSRYNEFKINLAARNNIYTIYKNMPKLQIAFNSFFLLIGFFIKYLFFLKQGYGNLYCDSVFNGIKTRKDVKKHSFNKKNWKNYFKIEKKLIVNTITFLFR